MVTQLDSEYSIITLAHLERTARGYKQHIRTHAHTNTTPHNCRPPGEPLKRTTEGGAEERGMQREERVLCFEEKREAGGEWHWDQGQIEIIRLNLLQAVFTFMTVACHKMFHRSTFNAVWASPNLVKVGLVFNCTASNMAALLLLCPRLCDFMLCLWFWSWLMVLYKLGINIKGPV